MIKSKNKKTLRACKSYNFHLIPQFLYSSISRSKKNKDMEFKDQKSDQEPS